MRMAIDSEWFKTKIKESTYGGQVAFAKAMGRKLGNAFDQPMLSRILKAERKVQVEEVYALAGLLDESPALILEKLGYPNPNKTPKK